MRTFLFTCSLALALVACHQKSADAPIATDGASTSAFRVFAEGPCAKLSVQPVGERRFLVYGDTGYDLHDWNVGEHLAAAESFVELKNGAAFRVPGMYADLPSNAGGYSPFDLRIGGGGSGPWLLAVDTRYAARGAGALFERRSQAYALVNERWQASDPAKAITFPDAARSLPPLPVGTMCTKAGAPALVFVPLTSTTFRPKGKDDGAAHVFVAGRCQDESHINYRRTTLVVAHGAPGADHWDISSTPDASVLDGIVNLGLYARAANDVYLTAWEPFVSPERRVPYLVHSDGRSWQSIDTGLPEGLMSVSGTPDGALWLAAGRALYVREAGAPKFQAVDLPPLLFASVPSPPTLRIHTVRAITDAEVWVEATYRVKTKAEKEEVEQRASVLYRLDKTQKRDPRVGVLYCDAREPAENAIAVVE